MLGKKINWVIIIALFVLVVSNPSEQKFLSRVATDYGMMHGGMQIDQNQLRQMGSSNHRSYLLFSTFSYQFGNVGVNYWGIASFTFFINSYQADVGPPTEIQA